MSGEVISEDITTSSEDEVQDSCPGSSSSTSCTTERLVKLCKAYNSCFRDLTEMLSPSSSSKCRKLLFHHQVPRLLSQCSPLRKATSNNHFTVRGTPSFCDFIGNKENQENVRFAKKPKKSLVTILSTDKNVPDKSEVTKQGSLQKYLAQCSAGYDIIEPKRTSQEYESLFLTEYSFTASLIEGNREILRNERFRGPQLGAMQAILQGKNAFVIAATGMGKSLIYQLPLLTVWQTSGLAIVFSPLLALIDDQIKRLEDTGLNAAKLTGSMSKKSFAKTVQSLYETPCKLHALFTTPEMIAKSRQLNDLLKHMTDTKQLKLFVVDEAHCVSVWGNDFRKSYRSLGKLKKMWPEIPVLCLTASANARVIEDVYKALSLNSRNTVLFKTSIQRTNISLEVRMKKNREVVREMAHEIGKLNLKKGEGGIIYCLSVADCQKVCSSLKKEYHNSCDIFHSKLSESKKQKTQQDWLTGKLKVICATGAFGLGIDKPNARFVFHHSMPKSIDAYYQEIGRAGRDGLPSQAILFFSPLDVTRLQKLDTQGKKISSDEWTAGLKAIKEMVGFCENRSVCRQSAICEYFGETRQVNECLQCDVCGGSKNSKINYSSYQDDNNKKRENHILLMLERHIRQNHGKSNVTAVAIRDAVIGRQSNLVKRYKLGVKEVWNVDASIVDNLVRNMIRRGILQEKFVRSKKRFSGYSIINIAKSSSIRQRLISSYPCMRRVRTHNTIVMNDMAVTELPDGHIESPKEASLGSSVANNIPEKEGEGCFLDNDYVGGIISDNREESDIGSDIVTGNDINKSDIGEFADILENYDSSVGMGENHETDNIVPNNNYYPDDSLLKHVGTKRVARPLSTATTEPGNNSQTADWIDATPITSDRHSYLSETVEPMIESPSLEETIHFPDHL